MKRKLSDLDLIGLFFAGLCVFESLGGLLVRLFFSQEFHDYGTGLHWFGRFMFHPITLVIAGVVPMALMAEGVLRRKFQEEGEVARCVVAIVAGLGLPVGFLGAFHVMPIFTWLGIGD